MNVWYLVFAQMVLAFVLAAVVYPSLFEVGRKKGLYAHAIQRSSHKGNVPVLGGVGIFFVFSLVTMAAVLGYGNDPFVPAILALYMSLFLLFFIGLKDDMVDLSPGYKTMYLLLAALLFLGNSGLWLSGFGGIFGVSILPQWISWGLTFFLFVLGINAFNLIDGVDGLAGGVAALAAAYFGICFMAQGEVAWGFVSFGLFWALLGFLRFNFSKSKKLFMGDSGSIFVGFLLVVLSLRYINRVESLGPEATADAVLMVLALFSYPLTDVARVFAVRIKAGKSPFHADKNHLHHYALNFSMKHYQITLAVVVYTLGMALLMYLLSDFFDPHIRLALLVAFNLVLGLLPSFLYRIQGKTVIKLVSKQFSRY